MVCEKLLVCETSWENTVGLLGRDGIDEDTGLLIRECRSIHMFFMKFPIDLVYVDAGFEVVKIVSELKPWRLSFSWLAESVIELKAGAAENKKLRPGMKLALI